MKTTTTTTKWNTARDNHSAAHCNVHLYYIHNNKYTWQTHSRNNCVHSKCSSSSSDDCNSIVTQQRKHLNQSILTEMKWNDIKWNTITKIVCKTPAHWKSETESESEPTGKENTEMEKETEREIERELK